MADWKNLADRVITTDLLIIGSEGAGGSAAIYARRRGIKVTVVTKGSDIRRSGASVTGDADLDCDSRSLAKRFHMKGATEDDSQEQYFIDMVRGGKYLNNQKLVEVHVADAPDRFADLLEWGVPFREIIQASGHTYPRGAFVPGPLLMAAVRGVVIQSGAELVTNVMVTDLLTEEDRVVGAVGVDMETGDFIVFHAKAVINATGGAMRIYPFTTAPEELTGDGMVMSYRAGAELINMEFPMFLPGAFPYPEALNSVDVPFLFSTAGNVWGAMLNNRGDRFMRHWDPVNLEHTTRDICSVAMMLEVRAGRGSEHGGVYVSINHIPKTIIEYWEKTGIMEQEWLYYGGFDIKKLVPQFFEGGAIESVPACHFWNGGLRINERCETNLPGYYASGEVTGGVHGANRLSGNAFTEMIVWGVRSGIFAGEYASQSDLGRVDPDQVAALKRRVYRPMENEGGISPTQARNELKQLAWEKAGVIRNGPEMEEALRTVRAWKEERVPAVTPRDKRRTWNRDWIFALEYESMVDTLEMVLLAALERKESRGANYRLDYPMTDNDNWLKVIAIKRDDAGPRLWTEPVVITRYQPPAGVFPYGKLEPGAGRPDRAAAGVS